LLDGSQQSWKIKHRHAMCAPMASRVGSSPGGAINPLFP
jgi:hypothetical protein